jgi:hypothetical protein
MDIAQLIQTLVATVVGGLIVIATNWISARGKRRQDIQEWYEQTYIIEGIDPLVEYYQKLSFSLIDKLEGYTLHVVQKDIPVDALSKVRILLKNDPAPLNIILLGHALLANPVDEGILEAAADAMQDAIDNLLRFRLELTKVISSQVNNKHYVADTVNLVNRLEKIRRKLYQLEGQQKEEHLSEAELSKPDNEVEKPQKAIKRRNFHYPRV